jgi:hypothetical protein
MCHNIKVDDTDDENEVKNIISNKPQRHKGAVPNEFKDRLYQQPDYAAIIQKTSIAVFELELESLV